ncbi:hypothetical protein RB595_004079 [Gaeumannomyces hyphopodioides]
MLGIFTYQRDRAAIKQAQAYVSCLSRGANSSDHFGGALGQVWANAADPVSSAVDLDRYQQAAYGDEKCARRILKGLPTYAWDNQRVFWHESRRSRVLCERSQPGHPLLGTVIPDSTATDITWHNVLRISDLPWLDGHQLQGQTVFPAAAYVALAVEAGLHLVATTAEGSSSDGGEGALTATRIELKDVHIGRAIAFQDEKTGVETLFSLSIDRDQEEGSGRTVVARFRSRSVPSQGSTEAVLNASGAIVLTLASGGLLLLQAAGMSPFCRCKTLRPPSSSTALGSMRRKLSYGRGRVAVPARPTLHRSEKGLLVHPGLPDAPFQVLSLAYSWPRDGRPWPLHVPVSIRSIKIDVAAARASVDDTSLPFDSIVTADGSVTGEPGIAGDVNVFTRDGSQGLVQVEGIRVIPFAAAAESQDTQMFFTNVQAVAFPDGELAMQQAPGVSSRATKDETELGWLLERISHFYLARLVREIRPGEEARAEWHHQKLMNFARHAVSEVASGRQPYGKREWAADVDNPASLMRAIDAVQDRLVEVRLMRSVGEHLAEAVRGRTVILEHMLKDGMLNQYYVDSLGLRTHTALLAQMIGQLTHVNPRMRILEIGGGTGGATKSILRRIGPAGFEQYTLTEISSGFFGTAQGVFSQLLPPAAFGRMSFKVLDAEKDVLGQGFAEGSYDLLIAFIVLHATRDLEQTLRNVRKLLRPGGYLVMLEVTSNVAMRFSFTMGGLEGWWLGAESGRPWTPYVSSAEWHSMLLQSGFTGVEAATPEIDTLPRPHGVLVSRATDERLNAIISPASELSSPLSTIPDELFIVTGGSLRSLKVTQSVSRVLRPYCSLPITVTQLEALPEALDGVSNSAKPDVRMQFIDYATGARLDPYVVADDLLRLCIITDLEQQQKIDEILWMREPEIRVDSTGRRWVSRIMPHSRFNAAYNSHRRAVLAPADPTRDRVEVHHDRQGQPSLVRVHDAQEEYRSSSTAHGGASAVKLRAIYSAPLRRGRCLTLGEEQGTSKLFITLGAGLASVLRPEAQFLVPYSGSITAAPAFLRAVASRFIASVLAAEAAAPTTTLILVEPGKEVAALVAGWSSENEANVVCVTSHLTKKQSAASSCPFVYIHPRATNSSIQGSLHQVKSRAAAIIIDMQGEKPSPGADLAARIHGALRLPEQVKSLGVVLAKDLGDAHAAMLCDAVDSAFIPVGAHSTGEQTVPIQGYVDKKQGRADVIVDWTNHIGVPLRVKPLDAQPLMRGDRTYLLVGLAGKGGLGFSLAEYLARQGARHIVLTSRNPGVDESLTRVHAANGVRIEAFANDVTNEASLRELVAELRRPESSWPPIAGVANGAMVLHDVALQNMTHEQMIKVLRPKVEGTRILDDIFRDDLGRVTHTSGKCKEAQKFARQGRLEDKAVSIGRVARPWLAGP